MNSQLGTLIDVPAAGRPDRRVRMPAATASVREAIAQADIVEQLWGGAGGTASTGCGGDGQSRSSAMKGW